MYEALDLNPSTKKKKKKKKKGKKGSLHTHKDGNNQGQIPTNIGKDVEK
jgi:hypothetical protein